MCAMPEIVATISSKSAGPGTRQNIDEFTRTTSRGLEVLGGADKGKAIIILNPADPPILMRDTIFALAENPDEEAIRVSVHKMVQEVQQYVPGYRLKVEPLCGWRPGHHHDRSGGCRGLLAEVRR